MICCHLKNLVNISKHFYAFDIILYQWFKWKVTILDRILTSEIKKRRSESSMTHRQRCLSNINRRQFSDLLLQWRTQGMFLFLLFNYTSLAADKIQDQN